MSHIPISHQSRLTVAVAGATGHAGQALVRALANHGARIRALVRNPDRLGETHRLCEEIRVVEVTDRNSLKGSLNSADGLISAVGKTLQSDHIDRRIVDVDANRFLFEEAKAAGIKKIGFVSAAAASPHHPSVMLQMKAEVEQSLRMLGVPYLIVRPSGYFSDLWEVFRMCQMGVYLCIGDGRTLFNPISVEDLAEFTAAAFLKDFSSSSTEAVGGPQTLRLGDLAPLSEAILDRRIRTIHIPVTLARSLVYALKPFDNNSWQLAQFFVESIAFAIHNGNSMLAPKYGSRFLSDYFKQRQSEHQHGC